MKKDSSCHMCAAMAQRGGVYLLGIIIGVAGQRWNDLMFFAWTQKPAANQCQIPIDAQQERTGIISQNPLMCFLYIDHILIIKQRIRRSRKRISAQFLNPKFV